LSFENGESLRPGQAKGSLNRIVLPQTKGSLDMRKLAHLLGAPQGVTLPKVQSYTLTEWFRELDDLSSTQARTLSASLGVSCESILSGGNCKAIVAGVAKRYGLPETLCSQPRGSVVCSVRDADGEVIGIHDADIVWLTHPVIHFSNCRRFRDGVYLAANTFKADAWAIEHNGTALGLNGCTSPEITAALAMFGNPVQVITETRRLAA
jgi:hypothetical protein